MTTNLTKREFIGLAVSTFAAGAVCMGGEAADRGKLSIRFLGTGAADWKKRDSRGEYRRLTSLMLNRKVLVDFTPSNREMMPSGCYPSVIFYTHSHDDHYNPAAAVALGIRRAYVHESWHDEAIEEFRKASEQMKTLMPEVLPLVIGKTVEVDGMMFTPLPSNHVTSRPREQTIMYLIENADGVRLLYATDTAGIPARALQIIGEKPISAAFVCSNGGADCARAGEDTQIRSCDWATGLPYPHGAVVAWYTERAGCKSAKAFVRRLRRHGNYVVTHRCWTGEVERWPH